MKSVKKMLSLLLVAMLLVTAIPFAASASDIGTPTSYPIKYYVHDVGRYDPTELTTLGLPTTVTVNVLTSDPDPSFIVSEALKVCSAATAKAFIAQAAIPDPADFTIGNVEVTFENGEVHYTLPVTLIPTSSVATDRVNATILEKVGSSYVDNGKTIPVDVVVTTTTNPNTTTVTVSSWPTAAQIKERYAAPFEGVTVNVDRTYVDANKPYICISTSASSSSSGGSGLGNGSLGGGSNTGNGGNNNNTGSGSGSGSVATFKATFLNVNGMQAYSESVASNGKVTISASELNGLVGSKDGYEHIGWKSSFGTQTTSEVVRNNITANVTYTPVFQSLTNNNTWTPGSGSSSTGGSNGTTGSSNTPTYSEVPGNVYLEIYTNKNFGSYDARFSITNNSNKNYNIGTDGTVSAEKGGDLWNLMASIYTAKDSNGMEVKLYQFEDNNFPVDWAFGNYYTSISNLTAARQNKDITIRVVVNNVYRKTADTSNPKTGDPIMMSVAVLGITACGLAAAYIYSKKRKAV